MRKIQPCKVCKFSILLYYARKSVTTMWKCGNAFSSVNKSIQNSQTLHYYTSDTFQHFKTKLHNFTKFRKLFPTVLKLFSNSKVCLTGKWSIRKAIPVCTGCFTCKNRRIQYDFHVRQASWLFHTHWQESKLQQKFTVVFSFRWFNRTCWW